MVPLAAQAKRLIGRRGGSFSSGPSCKPQHGAYFMGAPAVRTLPRVGGQGDYASQRLRALPSLSPGRPELPVRDTFPPWELPKFHDVALWAVLWLAPMPTGRV